MALLRAHSTDEYWAEYATLVIRDRGGEPDYDSLGLLAENATDIQPGGTIACAGAGWLWANASSPDGDNEVRLEAHDSAPPDDRADWDDVVETPYLSFSGAVGLSYMTCADDDEHTVVLGPAGHYRVRVCCRRQPDTQDAGTEEDAWAGDTWRLQFWPEPGDPEPPRWLARAPVAPGEPSMIGDGTLDPHVSFVLWGAHIAAREHPEGASAAQIAAARATESAFADQTDPAAPLWPPAPRPYLTTGHPDLDAFEARVHAETVAEWADRQREVDELAARFGVPEPVTVGDVLPLLVAMGLLTVTEDGGEPLYRPADPARQPADPDGQEIYASVDQVADLVAVALWAPGGRSGTLADLAERLLMSPEVVRAALRYAEEQQSLRVGGDPGDTASQLTLTALPRREEPAGEPQPLPYLDLGADTVIQDFPETDIGDAMVQDFPEAGTGDEPPRAVLRVVVATAAVPQGPPPLPAGAPPRAGVVTTSGDLVLWRDGSPGVLASVPDDASRAVQTPYGIAVLSFGQCVLVRPDGETEVLATGTDHRGAVSADGRYLALSYARYGRWPKFELYVIDLTDGSRQTLRWPEDLSIDGMYDGAVYFGSADAGSLRWTPGRDPEPLPWKPRTVDRLTGAMLIDGDDEGADGWLVIGQDGERHNVLVSGAAELALGGTQMMYFRYAPPAVTLFDVATGGASPRVMWLPEGCDTSTPHCPAWEDPGHLIFRKPYAMDTPAVRLDVRTGAVEAVPLPGVGDGHHVAAFVESLHE